MIQGLKRITCDRTCGFMVQSSDTNEIIAFMKMHAMKVHEMNLEEKDIKEKIKAVLKKY